MSISSFRGVMRRCRGAGQTWSLFMDPDVFPNAIDYWGPTGMMFLRNLQVRRTPYKTATHQVAVALEAPGSALDTGKVQDIDPLNIQSENNNDGGNDLAPDDDILGATTLPLLGVLAYYDHYWTDKWSSSLGWGYANQETSGGRYGAAHDSAHYGNVNLLYYPVSDIMVGGEFVYGKLTLKDDSDAADKRFQMSFEYNFD